MSDILSLDYQSSWEEFQRTERVKELPLRIRIGLRDQYYKPDHVVSNALASLRSELGGAVDLKVDWAKLWTSVSTEFPETAEFVPAISGAAAAFITAVETCISGTDETWGNALLDAMKAQDKSVLELYLLVDTTISSPKALYLAQNASVALKLPKAGSATYNSVSYMMIVPQILGIFDDAKKMELSGRDPEWVDAGIDDVKIPQLENAFAGVGLAGGAAAAVEKFPDVSTVPRPDMLMEQPPYIAVIRSGARAVFSAGVELTCNHPKTLDFMATYLEKYASVNPNNSTKATWWRVDRHDSRFGNGLVFDKLTVEENKSNWNLVPTPMLMLSLLQGTLGYSIHYTDGNVWVLRRETKFATR